MPLSKAQEGKVQPGGLVSPAGKFSSSCKTFKTLIMRPVEPNSMVKHKTMYTLGSLHIYRTYYVIVFYNVTM